MLVFLGFSVTACFTKKKCKIFYSYVLVMLVTLYMLHGLWSWQTPWFEDIDFLNYPSEISRTYKLPGTWTPHFPGQMQPFENYDQVLHYCYDMNKVSAEKVQEWGLEAVSTGGGR